MKPIQRSEIVDWQTYEDGRAESRPKAIAAKAARRIQVGEHFTFLFENRETIRYQVQEMMRVEKIVREADVQHEIDTYNELLFDDGRLGCSLLIGIDDPAQRDVLLTEWRGLCEHVYALMPGGEKVRPEYDTRQVGEERLSSVQYLAFPFGGVAPDAIGVDHPKVHGLTKLTDEQRAALQADLDE